MTLNWPLLIMVWGWSFIQGETLREFAVRFLIVSALDAGLRKLMRAAGWRANI